MRKSTLVIGFVTGCLFVLAGVTFCVSAQTTAPNEWTWAGGSSMVTNEEQTGVYGTLGQPAPGNLPPARADAAAWTDSSGNFWMFGGEGLLDILDGLSNDLWEFNPSTNQWAWMGGSQGGSQGDAFGHYGTLGTPSSSNIPGGRYGAASWTDNNGNFWLFGGMGFGALANSGYLNDLWEFNPSTKQWAWMAGSNQPSCLYVATCSESAVYGTLGMAAPGNNPGGRIGSSHWVDKNGNLWLFGGDGFAANGTRGTLNDLWEFNPSTNEWAWMGGSSTVPAGIGYPGQAGMYGTLGMPAAGNIPGGRTGATYWSDNSGKMWLFGGSGYDAGDNEGALNDLWMLNPATNAWTWMGGSSMANAPGVYGTLGWPAAGNIPSGRGDSKGWTDQSGNFWLFGGAAPESATNISSVYLDDLWEFNPSTDEWAWVGGSSAVPAVYTGYPGVYGTLGVAAAGNIPGSRYGNTTWTDSHSNLWLFSGMAGFSFSGIGGYDYFDDVWEYQPAPVTATPTFSPAAGTYDQTQMIAIADATAGAKIYYTTDGSVPTATSAVYSGAIAVASTATLKAVALASGYSPSLVATATYTITPPAATPSFSPPAGSYTAAQTAKISDATPGASIYYTTNGTVPSAGSALYSGALTVASTETIQAVAIAPGFSSSAVASASYVVSLPKNFSISASPNAATVNAGSSATSTLSVAPVNGFNAAVSFTCSGLPAGAACTFSPAPVTPSGTMPASTSLTITTASTSAALRFYADPVLRGLAFAGALCCFTRRRRRSLQLVLLLTVSILGVDLLGGCGGGTHPSGGSNPRQPAVASTITITAASGPLQHTTTFLLTVD